MIRRRRRRHRASRSRPRATHLDQEYANSSRRPRHVIRANLHPAWSTASPIVMPSSAGGGGQDRIQQCPDGGRVDGHDRVSCGMEPGKPADSSTSRRARADYPRRQNVGTVVDQFGDQHQTLRPRRHLHRAGQRGRAGTPSSEKSALTRLATSSRTCRFSGRDSEDRKGRPRSHHGCRCLGAPGRPPTSRRTGLPPSPRPPRRPSVRDHSSTSDFCHHRSI